MRALIVDDSRFIRDYLMALLSGRGMECLGVENGQQGLTSLDRSGPYDVALVDWNMPVMGGLDMVRAMRSDMRWNDVKILMVTTEAESGFIEAALNAGADEYLMKPFDDTGLFGKLEMIGVLPSRKL
jgi:two-component system, chemotaxis family, chemotaxis protein CheY